MEIRTRDDDDGDDDYVLKIYASNKILFKQVKKF